MSVIKKLNRRLYLHLMGASLASVMFGGSFNSRAIARATCRRARVTILTVRNEDLTRSTTFF